MAEWSEFEEWFGDAPWKFSSCSRFEAARHAWDEASKRKQLTIDAQAKEIEVLKTNNEELQISRDGAKQVAERFRQKIAELEAKVKELEHDPR